MDDPTIEQFLASMAAPDAEVRRVAAGFARRKGAAALPGLAALMSNADPAVAKGARRAMEDITHYAAQPGSDTERGRVADALLAIARDTGRSRAARAHALRLLGFAGGLNHGKALATLQTDPGLGEDARMAAERIRRSG